MGLDMYAYSVDIENVVNDFDFKEGERRTELAYWRKHRHLHNYMERLYREKGGDAESFNCIPLRLTLEDIDELEEAIKSNEICQHSNPGFFFGSGDCYDFPEEKERDLNFIAEARQAIGENKAVYYDSWW